jgi:hypothetical protein
MKIDRFNIPDFNSLNETKKVKNEEPAGTDFASRLENTNVEQQAAKPASSPLQNELTGIAKSTDFNNSISSRVATDQAVRAIVGNVISPELKGKIDLEAMMTTISDFAQNDPVLSQRLRNLLLRLS